MNIEKLAEVMRNVHSKGGSIDDVVRELYPDATGEAFDSRKNQISTLCSTQRKLMREAGVQQNMTASEINARIQKVLPTFRNRTKPKDNPLLDLFMAADA